MRVLAPALVALGVATALAAVVAYVGGGSAGDAIRALVVGSVGSSSNVAATLLRATPLLLTGAAVMLAFKSGVFNIGAEGQFLVGALAATVVGTAPGPQFGRWLLALMAGALAGAIWAAIAAGFRIGRAVSEVITTILLNFVALYLVSYAVDGPLQEAARQYPQSDLLVDGAMLWRPIAGSRLHIGVALALIAAVLVGVLLSRTALGLRLRAAGSNAPAARLAGFPVLRDLTVAFALSGAIAGLAGAVEVTGVTGRLYERISPGYGYTAIAVALLGGLRSGGVIAAALFFAALSAGAGAMERSAGVSSVLVLAVQGATLLVIAMLNVSLLRRVGRGDASGSVER
ncbi:ABC transporter permease [Candidatus Binatia bacterium]|nr:ABC transporter permease [Candidatus Binatia bacterium]